MVWLGNNCDAAGTTVGLWRRRRRRKKKGSTADDTKQKKAAPKAPRGGNGGAAGATKAESCAFPLTHVRKYDHMTINVAAVPECSGS